MTTDLDNLALDIFGQVWSGAVIAENPWQKSKIEMVKNSLRAVRREALEQALDCVPTNWLDSLLTGPKAVVAGTTNVEVLCRAIEGRIRSLIAAEGEGKKP